MKMYYGAINVWSEIWAGVALGPCHRIFHKCLGRAPLQWLIESSLYSRFGSSIKWLECWHIYDLLWKDIVTRYGHTWIFIFIIFKYMILHRNRFIKSIPLVQNNNIFYYLFKKHTGLFYLLKSRCLFYITIKYISNYVL